MRKHRLVSMTNNIVLNTTYFLNKQNRLQIIGAHTIHQRVALYNWIEGIKEAHLDPIPKGKRNINT